MAPSPSIHSTAPSIVSPLISVTLTVSPAFGRDMDGIEAVLGYDKTLTQAREPLYWKVQSVKKVIRSQPRVNRCVEEANNI